MSANIRDGMKDLSPPWLRDGQAERYLFNFGLGMDVLLEKLAQAVRNAMPTFADPSALPFIGKDVLIPQGLTESDANYASRLRLAYDAWQEAGTDWSLLRWTLHNLLEMRPAARIVANQYGAGNPAAITRTKWQSYEADADHDTTQPTYEIVAPGNWDWDSVAICHGSWSWARIWVVIYAVAPHDWIHPETWTIGDVGAPDIGDDSWSIGFTESANLVATVLDAVWLWKARHAQCVHVIVAFDESLFDPAEGADGIVNPNGEYGTWSKIDGNVYRPARTIDGARYCGRIG